MVDPFMTPAVVGVVATGVVQAGKDALLEQQKSNLKTNDALVEAAQNTSSWKVAVEARGRRLAAKETIFAGLYERLTNKLGFAADYLRTDLPRELSELTADVPQEDLQAPKASVALPAMQGLYYSLDEAPLKTLYLQLLATASDSRVAATAHPGFAEIIKQLTAEEAQQLRWFMSNESKMMISIRRITTTNELGSFEVVQNHVLPIEQEGGEPLCHPFQASFVDNWVRLGLAKDHYDLEESGQHAYDWVDSRPEFTLAKTMYEDEGHRVEYQKGLLEVTKFGQQFAKAVGIVQ